MKKSTLEIIIAENYSQFCEKNSNFSVQFLSGLVLVQYKRTELVYKFLYWLNFRSIGTVTFTHLMIKVKYNFV